LGKVILSFHSNTFIFSIRSKANNAIQELNAKFPDKVFEQAKTRITSSVANVLQQRANSLNSLQTVIYFFKVLF
jgi:hypothetical protein